MTKLQENIEIIDISSGPFSDKKCSVPRSEFLKNLSERGIKTVIRYYSDKDNLPCKNITPRERALLHDYGFNVAIVYQYNGRAAGRYTRESGAKDALFCLSRATEINQPEGSAIYFGIDADNHEPLGVIAYLAEVRKAFQGKFQVGCYGSGAVCKLALDQGVTDFTWIAEAPAWDGTRDFMNSGRWTIYQNKTDMKRTKLSLGGVLEIDTDILNPSFETMGAFAKDNSIVRHERTQLQTIVDKRRWVNDLSMLLFDKPGGVQVGHMCVARTVRIISDLGDGWVSIDIDEDGDEDGCCKSASLSAFDKMPLWRKGCAPMDL
jgi:hypothetical protein